jgi:hypothetical protein
VSTYARQNTFPPFPKTHVTAFLDLIAAKDIGEIWMAKTASGEVAAAEVIVWDNKLAHRWSAASSKDLIDTGAPSLLLYTILQDLKKRSFPHCNFFSGNSEQLTTFASSFNPLLQPYYSVGSFNMEYTLHRIARPFYHALLAVPFLNPSRR